MSNLDNARQQAQQHVAQNKGPLQPHQHTSSQTREAYDAEYQRRLREQQKK